MISQVPIAVHTTIKQRKPQNGLQYCSKMFSVSQSKHLPKEKSAGIAVHSE